MSAQYQLGILFVHGMGEQHRGDTLGEQGEAVVRWLQRRFEGDATTRVRIGRVSLGGVDPSLRESAEIEISFQPRDETGPPSQGTTRWLLSESWWAGSFRRASSIETLLWAVSAGPWLIAAQLDGVGRRATNSGSSAGARPSTTRESLVWRAIARGTTSLILAAVAALVAALIAPIALLLGVLALIPIPFVRDAVAAALHNITGSYGDLYRLVASDIQFGAMWSQVHFDIADLTGRCERVAIVAHSQGSAISWQAIRRLAQLEEEVARRHGIHRDRLSTFVTYGQALRKLKMLYLIRTTATLRERAIFFAWSLVSTASLAGLGFAAFLIWSSLSGAQLNTDHVIGWAGVAGVLVWLAQMALGRQAAKWAALTQRSLEEEIAGVASSLSKLKWSDYWASADPAPIGPLLSPPPIDTLAATQPPSWQPAVASYKVRNFGSTVLDHMVYWSNVTEFISAVIYDVTRTVTSMPFSRDHLPAQLSSAIGQRHWRVGLLVGTRWVYFVTAASLFIVWFATLVAAGSMIFDAVSGLFQLEVVQTDYRWLRSGVGGALFAAGAAAGWYAVFKFWNLLIAADGRRWFRSNSAPIDCAAARGWVVGLVLTAVGCFGWLWTVDAAGALIYLGFVAAGSVVLRILSLGGTSRTDSVEAVEAWPRWSWLTLLPPILIGSIAVLAAWLSA